MALVYLSALGEAALLAGCSGSSSDSSGNAEVRVVNACSNGGSSTVSVNGSSISSNQNYFSASSYNSKGGGTSSLSFSLSNNSSISYPAAIQNFLAGNFYSLILVGRADITSPSDPRYPTLIVASDTFTTPSTNQASVRFIHAAPDAGNVDVLINGTTALTNIAYKSIGSYISEPSGNVTFQYNQTGTSTALVSSQTIGLSAGHVYTFYIVEPTVTTTPPVYGLQDTDDSSAS